jgi:hypothetical protein
MNTPLPIAGGTTVQGMESLRLVPAGKKASWVFLILLAPALLAPSNLKAAENTPPPVVFSVEPEENGNLVYLPIAPETANDAPRNLFGLRLNIANHGANNVRLNNIRVTFTYPDNATFA